MRRVKALVNRITIIELIVIFFIAQIGIATALELVRQKGTATYIVYPILNETGAPVTGATGLDSELIYFSDGGSPASFTDLAGEASEIGTTGAYYTPMNASETNHDYIVVQTKTNTTGANTQMIQIRTMTGDPADIATPEVLWDEPTAGHTTVGSYGEMINGVKDSGGNYSTLEKLIRTSR